MLTPLPRAAPPPPGGRKRSKRERLVYRLLSLADVRPQLLGEEVHILWPDDGVWYMAIVERVSAAMAPCMQSATVLPCNDACLLQRP